MNIVITQFTKETNWIKGKAYNYEFVAKHFDEGSSYGIRNGRTSKLWVCDSTRKCVANYDRGWDIRPATKELEKVVNDIIDYLEKLPKRFVRSENE